MTPFDLSRLGAWADLPFFAETLPDIERKLGQQGKDVFPPRDQTFAALELAQPDDVRVVIFGQDPYPQPGKAHGLAFSIPTSFPPRTRRDSLNNIFAELAADLGPKRKATDLTDWADQGVLLFNCLSLTTPMAQAGGHRRIGWQALTQQVLARLAAAPRAYLLWGGDAHRAGAGVDQDVNLVLKSSHPSPLGAQKSGQDFAAFLGSRPFSRTNAWLQDRGFDPINWGGAEEA